MKHIKDLVSYNELLKKAKKGKGAININCFLLPDDIQQAIDEDSLTFVENDAGICIYINRKLFYQLYLLVNPKVEFVIEKLDLPIVCEFPGVSVLPDKCLRTIEILKSGGFVRSSSTKRMSMCYQPDSSKVVDTSKLNYMIVPAKEHHAEAIIWLWEQTFDPCINLLPDKSKLLQEIAKENVLCAIDEDGELLGVLQGEFGKSKAMIWHEAVHPKARGKKIGHALSQAYFDKAYQMDIKSHQLWVVLENEGSINFHAKFGYEYDGRFSEQYRLSND